MAVSGCLMEVPGDRVEDVLKFVSEEEGLGVSGIVLWPRAVSMKGCLEVCTELSYLGSERELPQASHPMVVRTWSGDTLFPVVGLGDVQMYAYGPRRPGPGQMQCPQIADKLDVTSGSSFGEILIFLKD